MGIYNTSIVSGTKIEGILENKEALIEAFIYDEVSKLSDSKRQEFVQSEAAKIMVEAGLIGKNTLVKLSRVDDLERRAGMASIQLAKEKNHPAYQKLVQLRIKEKEYLATIEKSFGRQGLVVAKSSQKEFMKKIPVGFTRK